MIHPYVEAARDIIEMVSLPGLIGALVWAVKKVISAQTQFQEMHDNSAAAAAGVAAVQAQVTKLETNHFVHLQEGINTLNESNTQAVEVLRNINTGIAILVDRKDRKV